MLSQFAIETLTLRNPQGPVPRDLPVSLAHMNRECTFLALASVSFCFCFCCVLCFVLFVLFFAFAVCFVFSCFCCLFCVLCFCFLFLLSLFSGKEEGGEKREMRKGKVKEMEKSQKTPLPVCLWRSLEPKTLRERRGRMLRADGHLSIAGLICARLLLAQFHERKRAKE